MMALIFRLILALWVMGAFIMAATRASHYMFGELDGFKKPAFSFLNELWVIMLWPLAFLSEEGRKKLLPEPAESEEQTKKES